MKKIEEVKFIRDTDLKGFESSSVVKSLHHFPKHSHDDIFSIGFMEEGTSYCLSKSNDDFIVSKGESVFINPGQVHSGIPVEDSLITYRMFYIDVKLMVDLASDVFEKSETIPEFSHKIIKSNQISGSFYNLLNLMNNSGGRLEKESALTEAIGKVISGYCDIKKTEFKSGNEISGIKKAEELLSENLEEKISLDEIAKYSGFSRYYFLRLFKEKTGLPPHVYRTQKRIDRAKFLLKKKKSFSEIALETGFTDQSHFTNKFRQFTGASPGQYI